MNTIDIDNCLFLIIDMQDKLVNMLNDKSVKEQAVICAKAAGILKVPAIITEQYPKGLGGTIEEIKTALPNAQYLEKTYFSAYKDKTIKETVDKYSKKQIIMFGIETHICVLQTAFDLINAGYELFIIENSCGSRSEDNKKLLKTKIKTIFLT